MGEQLESNCSLTKPSLREFVKTKYVKTKNEYFNKFDATERHEILE
jgi:hypothetical protein